MTGPKTANTRGSSSAGKVSRRMPNPWGSISAPSSPWSSRKAISVPLVGATAHSTEETVNPATPARKVRRRPNRSPSRPPVISPTESASA
jgi:hypothetical protein